MPIKVKSLSALDDSTQELLSRAAETANKKSHTNHLDMRAGATAQAIDGTYYTGALLANADGETVICPEAAAVAGAHSAGVQPIVLGIVAGADPTATDPAVTPQTPCGSCRSLLAAVSRVYDQEIIVYLANRSLTRIVLTTSGELLP